MLADWTISFNGVVLGDAETLPAVMPTDIDGLLGLPNIRSNDLTLIQRDGLWAGDDYLGERTITVSLVVQGFNPEEFGKAITAVQTAFQPGIEGETPFTFKLPGVANGVEAYVNARTRRRTAPLSMDFIGMYCEFEAELTATDPIIYAADQTSLTITDAVSRLYVAGSRPAKPVKTGGTLVDASTGQAFPTDSILPGEHYVKAADAAAPVTLTWRDSWV